MTEQRLLSIKEIFEIHHPIVKACVLRSNKVCSRDIRELLNLEYVIRVRPGYYAWKDNLNQISDFELAQHIIPMGIISMESAARIHQLIKQDCSKGSVSLTIPTNMIKPVLPSHPPIDLYYCSEEKFHVGVIVHEMKYGNINIYNKERTVCELFKYSNRVTNHLAVESLKNYLSDNDKCKDRLLEYALLLRVQKYIRPLVEVLT